MGTGNRRIQRHRPNRRGNGAGKSGLQRTTKILACNRQLDNCHRIAWCSRTSKLKASLCYEKCQLYYQTLKILTWPWSCFYRSTTWRRLMTLAIASEDVSSATTLIHIDIEDGTLRAFPSETVTTDATVVDVAAVPFRIRIIAIWQIRAVDGR